MTDESTSDSDNADSKLSRVKGLATIVAQAVISATVIVAAIDESYTRGFLLVSILVVILLGLVTVEDRFLE